jgi:hypothetical protein
MTEVRASPGERPALDVLSDLARVAAVERSIAAGLPSRCVQRLIVLSAPLLNTRCAQVSLLGRGQRLAAAPLADTRAEARRPEATTTS